MIGVTRDPPNDNGWWVGHISTTNVSSVVPTANLHQLCCWTLHIMANLRYLQKTPWRSCWLYMHISIYGIYRHMYIYIYICDKSEHQHIYIYTMGICAYFYIVLQFQISITIFLLIYRSISTSISLSLSISPFIYLSIYTSTSIEIHRYSTYHCYV